jgi:predicted transcriptional regulator
MARGELMSDTSLTIRVSRSTHELLRDLAAKSNATITAVVDEAVLDLQRKKFWADFNAACEAIEADPVASADLRREDAAWEATLADGLEEEQQSDEHQRRRGKPRTR